MAETFTYDDILAGDFPVVTESVTIASGQNLVRGTVLGKITSGGKYVKSLSASSDGSQTPDAILLEDCDASEADKVAPVAISGSLNPNALTYGDSHTAASIKAGLRAKSIFLKDTVQN